MKHNFGCFFLSQAFRTCATATEEVIGIIYLIQIKKCFKVTFRNITIFCMYELNWFVVNTQSRVKRTLYTKNNTQLYPILIRNSRLCKCTNIDAIKLIYFN